MRLARTTKKNKVPKTKTENEMDHSTEMGFSFFVSKSWAASMTASMTASIRLLLLRVVLEKNEILIASDISSASSLVSSMQMNEKEFVNDAFQSLPSVGRGLLNEYNQNAGKLQAEKIEHESRMQAMKLEHEEKLQAEKLKVEFGNRTHEVEDLGEREKFRFVRIGFKPE